MFDTRLQQAKNAVSRLGISCNRSLQKETIKKVRVNNGRKRRRKAKSVRFEAIGFKYWYWAIYDSRLPIDHSPSLPPFKKKFSHNAHNIVFPIFIFSFNSNDLL